MDEQELNKLREELRVTHAQASEFEKAFQTLKRELERLARIVQRDENKPSGQQEKPTEYKKDRMTDEPGASRTVLIVEDNRIERESLAAILRQEGHNVILAANGQEALDCLNDGPLPDVVLLDMLMSEIDGWELLKMLREFPELLALPIIVVTGLEIANPEWARALGAVGLIRKPIELEQLKDALAHAVG